MENEHNGEKSSRPRLFRLRKQTFFAAMWSNFLTGIIVAAPVCITLALIYWLLAGPMAKLDSVVKGILPAGGSDFETLLHVLPGVGILVACLALVLLGAFTKNFAGRALVRTGERFLGSVPVVRNLYGFFKNIIETALHQSERSFREVALVEYLREDNWVIAFVIGNAGGEVKQKLAANGHEMVCVFIPTAPNPTSGFLVFVPRSRIRSLSMNVEEAAKMVFSLGLVVPVPKDTAAQEQSGEKKPVSLHPEA